MVFVIFAALISFIAFFLLSAFAVVAIFESAGSLDSDNFNEEE